MSDPGNAGPLPPSALRNDDYIACYENVVHWAKTADRLGFDTMWFTEHHSNTRATRYPTRSLRLYARPRPNVCVSADVQHCSAMGTTSAR